MTRLYKIIIENKRVLLLLLFLAVTVKILNIFCFEVYRVRFNSMNSTLLDGDRLLVNKLNKTNVARNDIVVFEINSEIYVKRCAALPGDKIQIINGNIYINDEKKEFASTVKTKIDKEPTFNPMTLATYGKAWSRQNFGPLLLPKKGMSVSLMDSTAICYKAQIQAELELSNLDFEKIKADRQSYTFENSYYFMIGDNRSVSDDSRTNLGLVEEKQIIGTAGLIMFSSAGIRRILRKIEL